MRGPALLIVYQIERTSDLKWKRSFRVTVVSELSEGKREERGFRYIFHRSTLDESAIHIRGSAWFFIGARENVSSFLFAVAPYDERISANMNQLHPIREYSVWHGRSLTHAYIQWRSYFGWFKNISNSWSCRRTLLDFLFEQFDQQVPRSRDIRGLVILKLWEYAFQCTCALPGKKS
jgi:hypothetical protein